MREYDWTKANIDPKSHRFGLVDRKGQQSSVKQVGGAAAQLKERHAGITVMLSHKKWSLQCMQP